MRKIFLILVDKRIGILAFLAVALYVAISYFHISLWYVLLAGTFLYKPTMEQPGISYTCSKCLECVAACPNGSLTYKI